MTQTSYTAWDGNLYQWPPPDGWYQADDEKWWPEGYGPQAESHAASESAEADAESTIDSISATANGVAGTAASTGADLADKAADSSGQAIDTAAKGLAGAASAESLAGGALGRLATSAQSGMAEVGDSASEAVSEGSTAAGAAKGGIAAAAGFVGAKVGGVADAAKDVADAAKDRVGSLDLDSSSDAPFKSDALSGKSAAAKSAFDQTTAAKTAVGGEADSARASTEAAVRDTSSRDGADRIAADRPTIAGEKAGVEDWPQVDSAPTTGTPTSDVASTGIANSVPAVEADSATQALGRASTGETRPGPSAAGDPSTAWPSSPAGSGGPASFPAPTIGSAEVQSEPGRTFPSAQPNPTFSAGLAEQDLNQSVASEGASAGGHVTRENPALSESGPGFPQSSLPGGPGSSLGGPGSSADVGRSTPSSHEFDPSLPPAVSGAAGSTGFDPAMSANRGFPGAADQVGPIGNLPSVDEGSKSGRRWGPMIFGLLLLALIGSAAWYVLTRPGPETAADCSSGGCFEDPHARNSGVTVTYAPDSAAEKEIFYVEVLSPISDVSDTGEPAEGNALVATELRVRNDTPRPVDLGPVSFSAVTASQDVFPLTEAGCSASGVPGLDVDTMLDTRESAEGRVCWEVPADSIDTLLLGVGRDGTDGRRYISLND